MDKFRWIAAAALSAYACHLAVHHTTPIDRALPFLAAAVTLLAWLSYSEVMIGVPVLVVAEIALPDERLRLPAFGAVVAIALAVALLSSRCSFSAGSRSSPCRSAASSSFSLSPWRSCSSSAARRSPSRSR